MKYRALTITGVFVVFLTAIAVLYLLVFRTPEVVEEPFSPRQSHATYLEGLRRFDLDETMLGAAWIDANRRALEEPTVGSPPISEVVFFDPQAPQAVGYAFPVTRGRRVTITLDGEHRYYFADIFRLDSDGTTVTELIASRPDDQDRVVFEARSNGFYLLRLQPELLRGGRFTVEVTESASLAFPVEGASAADIWSFFGDSRDGGARIHHGVDIFAPRGTPIVAVSDSEVVRVGQRDLGGNVVVLRDPVRGINLYYAHLEEHRTTTGTQVLAGDVIGTVGNTGNAITTPPHLHIGIYHDSWRNPVDPWGFFVDPTPVASPTPEDFDTVDRIVGEWVTAQGPTEMSNQLPSVASEERRQRNRNPILRGAGDTFAGAEAPEATISVPPDLQTLPVPDGVPLQVIGGTDTHLRVRTVRGTVGLVPRKLLSTEATVGRELTISQPRVARDVHVGDAVAQLQPGTAVTLLADGAFGTLVRLPDGRPVVLDAIP